MFHMKIKLFSDIVVEFSHWICINEVYILITIHKL